MKNMKQNVSGITLAAVFALGLGSVSATRVETTVATDPKVDQTLGEAGGSGAPAAPPAPELEAKAPLTKEAANVVPEGGKLLTTDGAEIVKVAEPAPEAEAKISTSTIKVHVTDLTKPGDDETKVHVEEVDSEHHDKGHPNNSHTDKVNAPGKRHKPKDQKLAHDIHDAKTHGKTSVHELLVQTHAKGKGRAKKVEHHVVAIKNHNPGHGNNAKVEKHFHDRAKFLKALKQSRKSTRAMAKAFKNIWHAHKAGPGHSKSPLQNVKKGPSQIIN